MPPGRVSALTCINSLACERPVRQASEVQFMQASGCFALQRYKLVLSRRRARAGCEVLASVQPSCCWRISTCRNQPLAARTKRAVLRVRSVPRCPLLGSQASAPRQR
jgi:hypothetical protein